MSYRENFRNLPYLTTIVNEIIISHFRPILGQHGISEQFWRIIRGVDINPDITTDEICDYCQILRPSLGNILKHMQELELIDIQYDTDGSIEKLLLTDKSEELVASMKPVLIDQYRMIEEEYGYDLIEELFNTLEKVVDIHQQINADTGRKFGGIVPKPDNSLHH